MSRTVTRIVAGALATAGLAATAIAGATSASAQQYASFSLAPGAGACVSQYASYQVRGDGWATGQGAKFKLLRNGAVVWNTPFRANSTSVEMRSAYGTFPGAGSYSFCAQNTGTTNTVVTLQLRTDYEF